MKILIYLFLTSIFIQCAFTQELSCTYFDDSRNGYTCDLQLRNPNGFDNFTQITGNHEEGRSDSDVKFIRTAFFAVSTNFPSIVCQQFFNTRVIRVDYMRLERIGDEAFSNCRNLTNLQIGGNLVTEISENALFENRNLEFLTLFSVSVETLPRNIFANQQSVWDLSVSVNEIVSLPEGIFDSLTNLAQLFIFQTRISTFPDRIFRELRNIEWIDFSSNQIATLNPLWFENLLKLRYINLFGNQITSLPPNMFSTVENLQSIVLQQNHLTTIHSNSFGPSHRLNDLQISDNQINSIDERLIDNTEMMSIGTGGNPCDITSGWLFDSTPNREIIRAAWQRCFDNFEDNECEVGNLDERVCTLEEEVRELRELVRGMINNRR